MKKVFNIGHLGRREGQEDLGENLEDYFAVAPLEDSRVDSEFGPLIIVVPFVNYGVVLQLFARN